MDYAEERADEVEAQRIVAGCWNEAEISRKAMLVSARAEKSLWDVENLPDRTERDLDQWIQ